MTLTYQMPGDQDWDPAFWNRIGEGPGWDLLDSHFKAMGVDVDDSEDITLTFPPVIKK